MGKLIYKVLGILIIVFAIINPFNLLCIIPTLCSLLFRIAIVVVGILILLFG